MIVKAEPKRCKHCVLKEKNNVDISPDKAMLPHGKKDEAFSNSKQ
jgi:hypothetical protein